MFGRHRELMLPLALRGVVAVLRSGYPTWCVSDLRQLGVRQAPRCIAWVQRAHCSTTPPPGAVAAAQFNPPH